jgi:hypothetical protein
LSTPDISHLDEELLGAEAQTRGGALPGKVSICAVRRKSCERKGFRFLRKVYCLATGTSGVAGGMMKLLWEWVRQLEFPQLLPGATLTEIVGMHVCPLSSDFHCLWN